MAFWHGSCPNSDVMLTDLKFAMRMLAKNRVFTAVAICSLAIGIGANSAIFSFADALLLRPLPIPQPGELYNVVLGDRASATDSISYPEYRDLRDRNHSFAGMMAYQYAQFGLALDATAVPEMQFGAIVSGNFFRVLGVQPQLGRDFRPEEDQVPGRDPVAILSHALWVSRFNADRAVVGKKIRLNGMEFTVVGIAPASFKNMDQFLRPALYVPIAMEPQVWGTDNLEKRSAHWLTVKGRLKPGVTAAMAQADLNAIQSALKKTYPNDEPRESKIRVQTELQLRTAQSPPDTALVQLLALLAFCVLLVACANVAGLLLSRAAVRGREIAVRLAMGAARWQLLRQLFLENLLLAAGGGVAGIAVALAGIKLFASVPVPSDIPIAFDLALDQRVLLSAVVAAFTSALLFGLLPAWRSSRADVSVALKSRTDGTSRRAKLWGRNILVSAQLALSCVLLIVAAVVFMGFRSRLTQGVGFRTDQLYLMGFDTQLTHYDDAQTTRFYKQLLENARATPGVQAAALTSFRPFGFDNDSKAVFIEGQQLRKAEEAPTISDALVSDAYFDVVNIPIIRGRGILATDTANSARVAVVNEQFAERFWPRQDAVGRRFRIDNPNGPIVQVVGVAQQAKYFWVSETPQDFLYIPYTQEKRKNLTLYAESHSPDAAVLAPALRNVVHQLDRNMPIFDARTMNDIYQKRAVKTPRIITEAVAGMGLMALMLAVIGLYGLITYSVNTRRREIGIRMAVGAEPRQMLREVLRQALVLTGIGLGCGLVLGVGASRAVRSMMIFAGGAVNPMLFAAVLLPLVTVALLAAYAPARRAARIDPVRVLREE